MTGTNALAYCITLYNIVAKKFVAQVQGDRKKNIFLALKKMIFVSEKVFCVVAADADAP